jgi:hypothetical protein
MEIERSNYYMKKIYLLYTTFNILFILSYLIYSLILNKTGHTGINFINISLINLLFGFVLNIIDFRIKYISFFGKFLFCFLPFVLFIIILLFSKFKIMVYYPNFFDL